MRFHTMEQAIVKGVAPLTILKSWQAAKQLTSVAVSPFPKESLIDVTGALHGQKPMDAVKYSMHETLRDGTAMLVRAIRADDKQRLLRHFHGLSSQSVYYRFFGVKRSLTDDDLSRLTEMDFVNHVALAGTVGAGDYERFIGVGRYMRTENQSRAEVAFAVLDDYQGQGIGTLLLKHLARIARSKGITEFTADVLGSNHQMLEVFANSGFPVRDSYTSGIVHVTLDIST
jgi:GNAT superfamily N-acetyltransferase